MSGLQPSSEDNSINGVDVREHGNALRVATNTPHLVSLGTGRLSTAVTLHPIRQGRVTIGTDSSCDIRLQGTGVSSEHCRVENSHGVVTLYPVNGITLIDGAPVDKPTRLSQGCMLTIGRSNYLRFNHPEEAKLMKSVLPNPHISMSPIQFEQADEAIMNYHMTNQYGNVDSRSNHQQHRQNDALSELDRELDKTLKEMNRRKPPVAPRKAYKELDQMSNSSSSDQDSLNSFMSTQRSEKNHSKSNSIMVKVSKFEYYAKSQKLNGRTSDSMFSPKVFSANSTTVNTPAKDVFGERNVPSSFPSKMDAFRPNRIVLLNENNAVEARNCSYANVAVRAQAHSIDRMAKNFENPRPQHLQANGPRPIIKYQQPSPSFNRNPTFNASPVSSPQDSYEFEKPKQQGPRDYTQQVLHKEAESERLEEILHMCAEYEKQISSGVPLTPTEKKPHNKIITNGSLPRNFGCYSPNIVQTNEGYFVFDTNSPVRLASSPLHSTPNAQPNYENMNFPTTEPRFDYSRIKKVPGNYENVQLDRNNLGENVPQLNTRQFPITELSSPVMIRKIARNAQNASNYTGGYSSSPKIDPVKPYMSLSPIGSPYDNLHGKTVGLNKPVSPKTSSPRTRIKTTFAHRVPSSPQYFIFPSPPPIEELEVPFNYSEESFQKEEGTRYTGIEKQLSITEDIPMIDDAELTNDVEQRSSTLRVKTKPIIPDVVPNMQKNFEEIRQHLMADIPELDEIGRDIDECRQDGQNNSLNEKLLKISENLRGLSSVSEDDESECENRCKTEVVVAEINLTAPQIDEAKEFSSCNESSFAEENQIQFENLKEQRKKVLTEIYELKSKLSEIRSQEDDILRELEMEKALLKGEYDSEIAILNIEQQKKQELLDKAKRFEARMRESKQKQDRQQGEMKDRVDLAALKFDRVEKDFSEEQATSEELKNAHETLENERKLFEDMEFQHLEEEAEWLAYREELQNEIIALTQKIESQKSRILTLKSEATSNLNVALEESKVLQADSVTILNKIEELTNELKSTDDKIRATGLAWTLERPLSPEYGKIVNSNVRYNLNKPRIVSGEFDYSPPSSDDGDDLFASFEEKRRKTFKDKFFSIDQMSRSMIVDLGEKRNIDDLIDKNVNINNNQWSQEPVESKANLSSDSSPEIKEKKLGFWERNFDSLSRLKGKDKKSKQAKTDVMSQSLNENMFFNNENIESELGSFEKCNSLRSRKDGKSSHSKIPTFTALGKMIRKDSLKKSKENVEPAIANKENIDSNSMELSSSFETANKTRYIKNQKAGHSENRYQNRCGKSPEKPHKNYSEENRLSLTDSLEGDFMCAVAESSRISGDFENVLSDSARMPSQDDIDRISKVTMDAPLVGKNGEVGSLGRRTLDSLMEIEKRRMELLELKGCQVIENEREKISELKKRVQNEAKLLWESRLSQPKELENLKGDDALMVSNNTKTDSAFKKDDGREIQSVDNSSGKDDGGENESGSVFDDSTIADSASIDKLRHSQSDSYNSSALIDDDPRTSSRNRTAQSNGSSGRPLSGVSDMSDNSTVPNFPIIQGSRDIPMRQRKNFNGSAYSPRTDLQRPLTRYLPIDNDELNLRSHIESAGHQVDVCPHVSIDSTSCRGYLHKLGAKFHTWSKRWFVFDRVTKTLIYYSDKSEKKPRGGAYFQVIEEVYLDHLNMSKSPNPRTTFVLKTKQRKYYLMAPSGEAARIWIDVIFTGAQGYTQYQ